MVHKRDEVLAWTMVSYPVFCFRPPYLHSLVSGEVPQYTRKRTLQIHLLIYEDARGRQVDPLQTAKSSLWVPLISGSVLSVLDIGPLRIVDGYMAEVSMAVQKYQQCRVKGVCTSFFEKVVKINKTKQRCGFDESLDDRRKNELFIREESIPVWLAYAGYLFFSIVSIIVIPKMFPQVKRYFVIVAYVIAPSLCFCNAYGTGLTDMNMSYNYGQVALLVIASIVGKDSCIFAALVGCGVVKSVVHTSTDLMHDFKTEHLTVCGEQGLHL
ncbi:hypothetical protein NE237_032167 [Protea cynaroides]|uniref:Uncharacterized protein n=1 Tax=Protea cynaroides TaxID=273540 RepID=A0A9Q0R3A1_9MAGN|nr:hypothetical protein NE237_032167 [Protea cynaroides]